MKKFIYILGIVVCIIFVFVAYLINQSIQSLPDSHYEANMPSDDVFDEKMLSELNQYFGQSDNQKIEYEIIGTPRVTGIAYPKLYIWVTIIRDNKIHTQGAARVAAIDKEIFDITDFVSLAEMNEDFSKVTHLFPGDVVEVIKEKIIN